MKKAIGLDEIEDDDIIEFVERLARSRDMSFGKAAKTLTRILQKKQKPRHKTVPKSKATAAARESSVSDREVTEVPDIFKRYFTTTRTLALPYGHRKGRPIAEDPIPEHELHSSTKIWHGGDTGRVPDAVRAPHIRPSRSGDAEGRAIAKIRLDYVHQADSIFEYLRKVLKGQATAANEAIRFMSNLSKFLWSQPIDFTAFEKKSRLQERLPNIAWQSAVHGRLQEISIRDFCTDTDYRAQILQNGGFVHLERDGKITGLLGEAIQMAYSNRIEGAEREYRLRLVSRIRGALEAAP